MHLQNGATLVCYSGGKCLRGPQSAGLLLGRKDLVRAAWVHSAPHHGFGRSMKVGKEEAMGMLMAVEMWVKRDHDAEWKRWMSGLEHIARRLSSISGVTTSVAEATGLSNRTPSLRVWWDRQQLGFSGEAVARMLFDTEPRIVLPTSRNAADVASTGVSITAYMLSPGDEKIIGDRLHSLLSGGMTKETIVPPTPPAADLSGRWDVRIEYAAGASTHTFHLRQRNHEIEGSHQGDFISRDLSGTIDGDSARLRSFFSEQTGDSLSFTFSGKVVANEMSGTLDMGEYLSATWKARRR